MTTLFKNARVLRIRESAEGKEVFFIERADVEVTDDIISAVDGKLHEEEGTRVIDCTNLLLMPGLVNCHTHAYMTLFRNCADDIPFNEWLFESIDPMEGRMVPEDAYWGSMLAAAEMIRSGTTSYLDMHMHIHENARAAADSGLRAVLTRGLTGDVCDEGGPRRLREAKEEMERWSGTERLSFMLAPHAPFTCTEKYLRMIAEEAEKLGTGVHIHIAESDGEIGMIKEQYGRTPVEFIESTGLMRRHMVAAHCVKLTDSDMDILKENSINVVTNPASNMKLGNGFAHIPEMEKRGINLCIGTDGAASNNTLNMFREMGILSLIHKGTHRDAVSTGAQEVLRYATCGGAKALFPGEGIGQIKPGMKADLILLKLDEPSFVPDNNTVSALVYSVTGAEVQTVMVDGRILMENRKLLTIDEERVYFEAAKRAKRLRGN